MGISGREVAFLCLLLLLLMLLLLQNPFLADGSSRLVRGKKGSSSTLNPSRIDKNKYKGIVPEKGFGGDDEVLGAQKRRVYTGPNPLHNR